MVEEHSFEVQKLQQDIVEKIVDQRRHLSKLFQIFDDLDGDEKLINVQ